MAVKILHAADLHMDSPFDALPPEKALLRRREQREMLMSLARLVNDRGVSVVLLAGDLFDSTVSYHETGETLIKALSMMRAHVFIAPGNHDFLCERSPYTYLHFPENVHIFTSPSVKCVELPELGCRVWGAGMNAPQTPPLLHGFFAPDSAMTDIMVLHGDMTGGPYGPVTEDDIAQSMLDYLALGHVHAFSGIKKAGRTFYSYCGCPEGRGFDETGEKGVVIGTVDKSGCDLEFVPLGGREYRIIHVDVTGAEDIFAAVEAKIPQAERDICRIVLKGEYSGKADTAALAQMLESRFFHADVRDETVLPRDIWASAGDDSLTGLFVSRMRAKYDAAGAEEKRVIELAVKYGLSALENREEWRP